MSAAPAATARAGSSMGPSKQERRVIWLLLAAAFSVILNETVMGVAVPLLVEDLGITINAAQWLTTAFMLTMAVVIPMTGYLLQRLSTRTVFFSAMGLFAAGTLLALLSPGYELLLVARIVQAGGTAMMMPLLMTTIMTVVPVSQRGRFMGRITIVMAVAPALGPTVSGIILSTLGWRYLFALVLPLALAMLVIGWFKLRNIGENTTTPLDVPSVILSAFAFGGIVYGLSLLGGGPSQYGPTLWATLAVGVVALALFVLRQLALQKRDGALLDLRTFASSQFSLAVGLIVVMMMAQFGTIMLLPIYLQDVLGLEPVVTGLVLLPGGLAMGLLAPLVGSLYDRYGARPLVIPGSVLVSASLWVLSSVGVTTTAWFVAAVQLTLSAGLAFMFTPLFTSALGSLPRPLYTHGSAIIGTAQQLAGAAGTALFVALMAASTTTDGGAASQAAGVGQALTVGAALSTLGVIGAFFVGRPAASRAVAA